LATYCAANAFSGVFLIRAEQIVHLLKQARNLVLPAIRGLHHFGGVLSI